MSRVRKSYAVRSSMQARSSPTSLAQKTMSPPLCYSVPPPPKLRLLLRRLPSSASRFRPFSIFGGWRCDNSLRASRWSELIGGNKDGLNVGGKVLQSGERSLQDRPHNPEFIQHFLRGCVVTFSLDRQQIMIKLADGILRLVLIDAECAVPVRNESAFIHQIVELHRHALTMGIVQPKT